ncbi:VanW family protein [Planococcus sp. A6]|uniref:VanW family protein n=1 Tax=Planococcus sp. A6 TaxID=2992760 RepID=UPI00237B036D|nr:VanW family protein [Planococcus sp. A6]MDE0583621.1 VanW family protein [Planococcus sp. A6]
MDNKQFGKVFVGVFGAALVVFGTANAGAYAVDEWVFPSAEYGDYTYIGTTDVSNMAVADAKTLFLSQASAVRESSELHVTYLDATAKYPLKDVEISLDETLERAQSGAQNDFVFDLSETTTRSFLKKQFTDVPFTEADIANIHQQLETALEGGQSVTRVDINSDSLEMSPQEVAQSSFSHDINSPGAEELIEVIDGTVIAPDEQFDFLSKLEELALLDATDAELTEIASAIYGAVLRTNFLIEQRSIGEQVPENVPAGEEAAINRSLDVDFAFSNPNASSFTLNVYLQNGELTASVHGQPFVHTYYISTAADKEVEPRLIKQYSAFVSSGKKVKEQGRDGKRIEVVRSVLEGDKEVRVEPVSSDFYPPVHRVEVYPLNVPEAPATDANGEPIPQPGDEGFVDANNNGIHDPAEQSAEDETVVGDEESTGTELNESVDGSNQDSSQDTGTGTENASEGSGSENDSSTDDEPVYDKAGKRVE